MKIAWKHYAQVGCTLGTGLCELVAHYQAAGNQLPYHLTAGALLLGANVFGLLSKSITTPVVTPEMLSMAKTVLDRSTLLTAPQIEAKVTEVALDMGAKPKDLVAK